MRFQKGTKTQLGARLQAISSIFWQTNKQKTGPVLPCPNNLKLATLKGYGLICLAEELLRQCSFRVVTWLLLTVFSGLHNENSHQEDMGNIPWKGM